MRISDWSSDVCSSDLQLLCALRETAFGAIAANAQLEHHLRRECAFDRDALWYPGRAVMIVRNDPASGLFNGDVGLCLLTTDDSGRQSLQVWFEAATGRSEEHTSELQSTMRNSYAGFSLKKNK